GVRTNSKQRAHAKSRLVNYSFLKVATIMNVKNIFLSILAIMLFTTCSEEKLTPVNVDDETIPPPVNQVKVKNLSGAVQLTYQIPQSSSLLYVEAECTMTADRITTTKASYYQ